MTIRRFLHDESGSIVTELAFVLPLAATILMGLGDITNCLVQKMKIVRATNQAVEMAPSYKLGQNYDYIAQEAAAVSGLPASSFKVKAWLVCDDTVIAALHAPCDVTYKNAERWVSIEVEHEHPLIFPLGPLGRLAGANEANKFPLHSTATVRVQ